MSQAGNVIYRYPYLAVALTAIDVGYGDTVGAAGAYLYGLCGLSGSPQPAYGIAAISVMVNAASQTLGALEAVMRLWAWR